MTLKGSLAYRLFEPLICTACIAKRSFRCLVRTFCILFFARIFLITPLIIGGALFVVHAAGLVPEGRDTLQLVMRVLLEKVTLTPDFVAVWWPLLFFDFCAGALVYSWFLLEILWVSLSVHGLHATPVNWRLTIRAAVPVFLVDGLFRGARLLWSAGPALDILILVAAMCAVLYTMLFCFVLHEQLSLIPAAQHLYHRVRNSTALFWTQVVIVALVTLPFSIVPYVGWFLYLVALTFCAAHLYYVANGGTSC